MLIDADDVELNISAPAALAAAKTFLVPCTLTACGKSYRYFDLSDANMTAAVWKTVRGKRDIEWPHGLLNAALTAGAEVMSVWMKATSLAKPAVISLRSDFLISIILIFDGGVPRARSCRTMKPPTRPSRGC
jgi:hypothetical protein